MNQVNRDRLVTIKSNSYNEDIYISELGDFFWKFELTHTAIQSTHSTEVGPILFEASKMLEENDFTELGPLREKIYQVPWGGENWEFIKTLYEQRQHTGSSLIPPSALGQLTKEPKIERISYQSPFVIDLLGSGVFLVIIASIISGGEVNAEVLGQKIEFKIPSLASGLKELRDFMNTKKLE